MTKMERLLVLAVAAGFSATLMLGVGAATATRVAGGHVRGPAVAIGEGTARMYVDTGPHGEPTSVGIVLSEGALRGLPERMNTTSRCFDKDGDGRMAHGECLGDYQTDLELPRLPADLELPFRWATLNWNPEGHLQPAPPVWSAAHFDFHFFMADREVINSIRPGPCGEYIDCEDFEVATVPLPAGQVHADYIDVGAAVPSMGNHLVDSGDPELVDPSLGFSRTYIFGAYGGEMIFQEPMVSKAYLTSRPDECTPIKSPTTWGRSGYYPTSYCVRYDPSAAEYRVALEGLVHRRGSQD